MGCMSGTGQIHSSWLLPACHLHNPLIYTSQCPRQKATCIQPAQKAMVRSRITEESLGLVSLYVQVMTQIPPKGRGNCTAPPTAAPPMAALSTATQPTHSSPTHRQPRPQQPTQSSPTQSKDLLHFPS